MKKRVLAWITVLLLLTGVPIDLVCADASAAKAAAKGQTEQVMIDTAYEMVLPDQIDSTENSDRITIVKVTNARYAAVQSAIVYQRDQQALASSLRQAMVARQEDVVLYCQTSDDTDLNALAESLVQLALQETGNPCEGDYLSFQYDGWSCSMSYFERNGTFFVTITYSIDYYTTFEQEQEVTRRINALIDSFGFCEDTTDYQKVRTVYEYIAAHMTYDYDHLDDEDYMLQYTAYAALVNGTSVCQGYANLLYRMLRECGIPCRTVSGIGITSTGSGGHAWNIICLNGTWYNADLTWDDAYEDIGSPLRPYFLTGSEHFDPKHILDTDFTGSFAQSHPISRQDYVPSSCDLNGHSWGNWIVDITPTDVAQGHRYSTCTICGAEREETVEVLPLEHITVADLTLLVRHVAKIEQIEDEALLHKADVDSNGIVDAADLTILVQQLQDAA